MAHFAPKFGDLLDNFIDFLSEFHVYLSTSKKCRKSAKNVGDFGNDENCFKKRKSCVISIEAKNRSKIAMYLIFFSSES